jgi:two-component system chemotaxis response regulator CheB
MNMDTIKVLVVDDSAVIRRLVTEILDDDPRITVAGVARNGQIALEQLAELKPDAVTLDIEMPIMDGISCLKEIRKRYPKLPVVMFSTLTERGASSTLDALAAGASDYVTKPSNVGSVNESRRNIREQLVPKLVALTQASRLVAKVPVQAAQPVATSRPRTGPFEVLAIGSSTGGPDALAKVLRDLPRNLPVPVLIVQHMPALFTKTLSARLDGLCPLSVSEAVEGDLVTAGRVLVAPGGLHLEVRRSAGQVRAHLTEAPPENFCRPAVDVMFRSVAATYGGNTLAAVLTGMGRDGAAGAEVIRRAGGTVYVQDQETSVVWGMPGAVASAGQADRILPLPQMAPQLAGVLSRAAAREPETSVTAAGRGSS